MRPHGSPPAVWAVVVALALPTRVSPQDSPVSQALHRSVLDNGLQVLVVENHAVPLAMVLVAVRSGAFIQEPGEGGLAHLHEHLVFRGYGRDASAFGQAVAELEGRYNGSTDPEVVTYWVMVPAERTKKAIEVIARLVTRGRFSRDDLAEERRVVLDEISRAASDPERTLQQRIDRQLWGAAWHRYDVGGDSASLEGITLHRVKQIFERYYVPNNAAVIVTGDVSPDDVFRQVERRFHDWKRGTDPFAGRTDERLVPLTASHGTVVGERNVRDVSITIAFRAPRLRDDPASTYAADALMAILNEPSSRFQQYLVGSDLLQRVDATYRTGSNEGAITFRGKSTAEHAEDAVRALVSALEHEEFLLDLTDDDLTIARRSRELDLTLGLEAGVTLAPELALGWASAGLDYYLTYGENLNQQTLTDLQMFAERYLLRRPKVVGVMGPPDAMAAIADWLQRSTSQQ